MNSSFYGNPSKNPDIKTPLVEKTNNNSQAGSPSVLMAGFFEGLPLPPSSLASLGAIKDYGWRMILQKCITVQSSPIPYLIMSKIGTVVKFIRNQ